MQYVAVHDPKRNVPIGTLLEAAPAQRAEMAGVVVLPVDPDLVPQRSMHPLGGFTAREWGQGGWLFDKGAGERGCPMLLHAPPDRTFLNWACGVYVPDGASRPDRLQLAGDPTVSASFRSQGFQVLDPGHWESAPGATGHWILQGRSRFAAAEVSILALCLHGVARGARVLWSAVSLSSQ